MSKKLPYAVWAKMDMAWLGEDKLQSYRHNWFSDSGKAKKYDLYREYCKRKGLDYDSPPENYWAAKEQPWHSPAGVAIGLMGVLGWFLTALVAGSTGQRKR